MNNITRMWKDVIKPKKYYIPLGSYQGDENFDNPLQIIILKN